MSKIVKKYKASREVRELALRLVSRLPQKDFRGEVATVHDYVKECVRYVKDIAGVETLQTPVQTLRLMAGDCDDKSILVASLLESMGHPTRFVAVGFRPGALSHVLVQTRIGPKWVSVETTEPVPLGWFPKGVKSFMVQHNREKK